MKIKFTHAATGELQFTGATCATPIGELAALYHTASGQSVHATDCAGLEASVELTDSAIYEIAQNVEAIGDLLAHVDMTAVGQASLASAGSLLTSLGNHIQTLMNMRQAFCDDLAGRKAKKV